MRGKTLSRRRFLIGAAGVALSASGGGALTRLARAAGTALPAPAQSGIEHVVVVMMENRSFDHLLGWLSGADGKQAGLGFPKPGGGSVESYHLTDSMGCAHPDPDHSYEGGRAQYHDGTADGFVLDAANDEFAVGYYVESDLPFFGQAARDWTVCDRYFAPILGPTYPNRIYQHAGTTDRIVNTTSQSHLPTIWDRLANAGLSGRYYYSDIPFTAIWWNTYLSISSPIDRFYADCAAGTLPSVSYVDPRFNGEEQGASNDDHPHADIHAGERFLADIYSAVTSGPGWDKTVLVVNFDEWGGFFDHVPPPRAPDTQPMFERRGFRVPALIISPFARRGSVAHGVYDHTSILRMIEWRWGLAALAPRDAAASNLAEALDFSSPSTRAPQYSVPAVVATPCSSTPPSGQEIELPDLLPVAQRAGFPV